MLYSYRARDTSGKTLSGLVEAPSDRAAATLLRDKQLLVVSLSIARSKLSFGAALEQVRGVKFNDIVNFTRQLSTMVIAGLSLPDALNILKAQTTNPSFSRILLDIEQQVLAGGNLADSLAKYPNQFTPMYLALVRAGESSGKLDVVLGRLAETLEAQRELRAKVVGAMIYPIIVLIGMTGVIVVMMTFVIPKLSALYQEFGIELPIATKILILISNFMINFWWLILIGFVGSVILYKYWSRTSIGAHSLDALKLKLPLFGDLLRKVILVDFTRTLSMLVGAGIHILDGLKILRDSLGNVLFRESLDTISQKVEKGAPLGESFAQFAIYPPIVSQMMKVGEETGKLDETLLKMSNYFEQEVNHLIKGLLAALEPMIIVVLAIVVGFVVFSIITPIFRLTEAIK